jgi:hypothetical protein
MDIHDAEVTKMLLKTLGRIGVPLALALTGALGVGCAMQPEDSSQTAVQSAMEQTTVEGIITTVEPDGTVVVKPAAGTSVLMYTRDDTTILRNGQSVKVTDLRPGDRAVARYVPGTRSAVEIHASSS